MSLFRWDTALGGETLIYETRGFWMGNAASETVWQRWEFENEAFIWLMLKSEVFGLILYMLMSLLEFVQNHGHGIFVKNDPWGSLFSSPSPNVGWLQKAPILPSPSSYPAAVTTLKIWSQNVPATPRRRDRVSMTPKKGSLVSRKFVETTHGQRSLETTLGAINTLVYIYMWIKLYCLVCIHQTHIHRRKFRSQTSDDMARWKAERGRGREKGRVEKRRSEKSKSQKKEIADARKDKKVAQHCVFRLICGSEGSKNGVAKAAGGEPAG